MQIPFYPYKYSKITTQKKKKTYFCAGWYAQYQLKPLKLAGMPSMTGI